jgi:aldehyde dehydrogenase (NAD+)
LVDQPLAARRCLAQLQSAVEGEKEDLREDLIAEGTDLPAGVVNVVPTPSNEVAGLLGTDPRVDMISFTGSTAVGKLLMRQGADTMKRMFLELGGKSVSIVLDDANPAAIVGAAVAVCVHAGQACAATTRMLVHRSLYDDAVANITAAYQAVPVGDPVLPEILVGPVISAAQEDRVLSAVERALVTALKSPPAVGQSRTCRSTWWAATSFSQP